MERKYIGIVKDHLGALDTHKTKSYSTYRAAHDAAEKLCKKTLGDRGSIDVEEIGIFTIMETNPLPGKTAKTMQIRFTARDNWNQIVCKSADYAKMVKTFIGLDEIVYASSDLFDGYELEIDNGDQVVFVSK